MKLEDVKVGMRVRVTKAFDLAKKGMTGKVVVVDRGYGGDVGDVGDVGIRFDAAFDGGHDLQGQGKCENGFGHWAPAAYIEPAHVESSPKSPKKPVTVAFPVIEVPEVATLLKSKANTREALATLYRGAVESQNTVAAKATKLHKENQKLKAQIKALKESK